MNKITIEVNGKKVEAQKNELLLNVLTRESTHVPTLCNIKDLFPSGACRMCSVEVVGQRNLVPSCAFPVADGMKILTHSPRVLKARKTILELLLASHPDDCLYCTRNHECELQSLADTLGVTQRRFAKSTIDPQIDLSSEAIIREQSKCILCGRCVRVCEEVMGVSAIDFMGRGSKTRVGAAFNGGLNTSSCVACGQCILACPTGALHEKNHVNKILEALQDPNKHVVVQHAPSVSVTLGEYFNLKPGIDVDGMLVAALRQMGFKHVFDTGFTADLTIMEEASELADRIQNRPTLLPMMTSCSPGWINFVEEFYPQLIPNLSTCKSPQQMMGALIKTYFSEKNKMDPNKIFSVSIMPCTAKKTEIGRAQQRRHGHQDIDAVMTTRELADLIKRSGIDFANLQPEEADSILGTRSSAGKIFGATGGVMEAAVRTAYFMLTGSELPLLELEDIRGLSGIKEASLMIGDLNVKVAVVSGLNNVRKLIEDLDKGLCNYHFIEVMTCPGGCIAGGGQPLFTDPARVRARMQALYQIDKQATLRTSHQNPMVQELYNDYLEKPLGEKSHHLLHTHYHSRKED